MAIAKALASEPRAWERARARTGVSPRVAGGLDLQLITTPSAFDGLEPEWNDLFQRAADPSRLFLGFNWNWHWCNHYLKAHGGSLAVIAGRQNGRLAMVWPLLLRCRLGFRTVTFMGAPVSQYGDVLLDRSLNEPERCLAEAWGFLTRTVRPDSVHLRKVRADSAVAGLMRRMAVAELNSQEAPYIDLRGVASFQAYEQRHSGKDRKNRRRKRNRLHEAGAVGFRRVTGAREIEASVAGAMAQKRVWLTGQHLVSSALADRRFDAFMGDVAVPGDRGTGGEIFELTLDGRPIATKITFTHGSYRGLHFSSYDASAEKFSPGSLILEEVVAAAIADGIVTLDFFAPAAPYKLERANAVVGVADYAVSVSLAGALYNDVYLRRVRPRLQRLAKTGPAPVRRLMACGLRLMRAAG